MKKQHPLKTYKMKKRLVDHMVANHEIKSKIDRLNQIHAEEHGVVEKKEDEKLIIPHDILWKIRRWCVMLMDEDEDMQAELVLQEMMDLVD